MSVFVWGPLSPRWPQNIVVQTVAQRGGGGEELLGRWVKKSRCSSPPYLPNYRLSNALVSVVCLCSVASLSEVISLDRPPPSQLYWYLISASQVSTYCATLMLRKIPRRRSWGPLFIPRSPGQQRAKINAPTNYCDLSYVLRSPGRLSAWGFPVIRVPPPAK